MQRIDNQPEEQANSANIRMADQGLLRSTFGRFASGVTVITCQHNGKTHGMTANSFISVSLDPASALISVKKCAKMHTMLSDADVFGLSVLGAHQAGISGHFAGSFDEEYTPDFDERCDVPIISDSIAWMVCRRSQIISLGDHSLFIGELIDCDHNPTAQPLVYFGGRYGKLAS